MERASETGPYDQASEAREIFFPKNFFFIPLGNKVYEGFGTFSGILFNDNFTLNFGTCR